MNGREESYVPGGLHHCSLRYTQSFSPGALFRYTIDALYARFRLPNGLDPPHTYHGVFCTMFSSTMASKRPVSVLVFICLSSKSQNPLTPMHERGERARKWIQCRAHETSIATPVRTNALFSPAEHDSCTHSIMHRPFCCLCDSIPVVQGGQEAENQ